MYPLIFALEHTFEIEIDDAEFVWELIHKRETDAERTDVYQKKANFDNFDTSKSG